jgi:ketosteroid isomerase-like protein
MQMTYQRIIVLSLAFFVLCLSPLAYGADDDLTALKANFEAEMMGLNTNDLAATLAATHDDIVLFGIFSPFPSNGKKEFEQAVTSYFGSYDRTEFTPVSPQFRIVGTTAVAWGHYQLAATTKGGEQMSYSHGRYIFTHVKVDDTWLILSMHISPLEPYRQPPF